MDINEELKKVIQFNLLFGEEEDDDSKVEVDLTEEQLIEMLFAGHGIYWELEVDEEGSVTKMIPLDTDEVVQNLKNRSDMEKEEDLFYDFNKRAGGF